MKLPCVRCELQLRRGVFSVTAEEESARALARAAVAQRYR